MGNESISLNADEIVKLDAIYASYSKVINIYKTR